MTHYLAWPVFMPFHSLITRIIVLSTPLLLPFYFITKKFIYINKYSSTISCYMNKIFFYKTNILCIVKPPCFIVEGLLYCTKILFRMKALR